VSFEGVTIEQALIVVKPGVMGNVDAVLAVAGGRAFMVTGNGSVFAALIERSLAAVALMDKTRRLRQCHRDRRSPESLLCALCAPLGDLCGEARWSGRHRRLGLRGSLAPPLFVAQSHF